MAIRTVCRVGINDAGYPVGIKGSLCPFYKTWVSMIRRCYDEKVHELKPCYSGCSVVDEWLLFSNFKSWMEDQD